MNTVIDKTKEYLYDFFIVDDKWKYYIKRIIYIACFTFLCYLDQVIGSATGYIQYGLKNYTGVVIAIIILTAYKVKDFIKIPYLIWTIMMLLYTITSLENFKQIIGNSMDAVAILWGIYLYGVIFIRMLYLYIGERKAPRMNWIPFIYCMAMLLAMAIIRSDYAWPKALLGACFFFYLTEFKERDLNNLFIGMLEGILVGSIIIQTYAYMYRPYDKLRYEGMYSHPNMNALMYLCAYCAVLGIWYYLKLKKRHIVLRIPLILLAGLIIGTMLYTGGRAAFIAAVFLSMVFLLFQFLSRKKLKILELLADGFVLVFSISICIVPAYWLIRYMPVYFNEPIYFEADVQYGIEKKIQKNEPVDSPKYIEFDAATENMFARYMWFLDEETANSIEKYIRELPDKIKLSLKAEAAEKKQSSKIAIKDDAYEDGVEPGSDRKHPLIKSGVVGEGAYDVRVDIYKYFWDKLTLVGKKNNVQGVWISKWTMATHCHNVFLQIAYDFGIIIAILFIFSILMIYIRVLIGLIVKRTGPNYFRLFIVTMFTTSFVVFGMFELNWIYGQLSFIVFFLLQYVVYHKEPKKCVIKEKELIEQSQDSHEEFMNKSDVDEPEFEDLDYDEATETESSVIEE